jgi:hypothetical protein
VLEYGGIMWRLIPRFFGADSSFLGFEGAVFEDSVANVAKNLDSLVGLEHPISLQGTDLAGPGGPKRKYVRLISVGIIVVH